MTIDADVTATAIASQCDKFKPGDKMVFHGPMLDLGGTDAVCCTALVSLWPIVCALRAGASPRKWGREDRVIAQCPDQASAVTFELRVDAWADTQA